MAKYKPDVFTKLSEIIRKAVEEAVEDKMQKHSITQELLDEGAFDVAKSYIDFLKKQATEKTVKP
jgi:hypothetical protein